MPIKIPKAKKRFKNKSSSKRSKKFPFQSPKGMHDTLPSDFLYIDKLLKILNKITGVYGFHQIDTPILEDVRLFERGTGLSSEVVSKQMFTLRTSGGKLAMRPEMTPGVLRAYIQNGLSSGYNPGKFFYFAPVFRHEQPQGGRLRQFKQIGFEIINSADPIYDAEVISASYKILNEAKLKNVVVKINSIGDRTSRPLYVKKLKEYYRSKLGKLCKDCQKRYLLNPLRLLDCKSEQCQEFKNNAPISVDMLSGASKNHFKNVLEFLDDIKIPYMIDNFLVRGLDYYTHTVFELFSEGVDFALGGGGRYDYLSETLSGPRMGAVGSALGVERIIDAMKLQEAQPLKKQPGKVFFVCMGDQAKKKSLGIMDKLYQSNVSVREAFPKKSLKAQLRSANKDGSDLALIFGQREVFEDVIIVRDMRSGSQETVPLKNVVDAVKRKLA